jgi:hypothetical protein
MLIKDYRPRRHIEVQPDFRPVITPNTARRRWNFVLQESCIVRTPGAGPIAACVMLMIVALVLVSGFVVH